MFPGQFPVLEDSEELRLQLFSLLINVLLPECSVDTLHSIVDPLHRVVISHMHTDRKSKKFLATLSSHKVEKKNFRRIDRSV